MTLVKLDRPIEHAGELYQGVVVRRRGPIAFLRYWRRRDVPGPPPFRVNLPWTVIDRLDPVDHQRVTAEMTRLTMPFIWPIAIWKFCFGKKDKQL